MRITYWLAAFYAVSASSSVLSAAEVDDISGTVMISRGDGYTRIETPTVVHSGDAIMARRGGSAKLTYDDGCEVIIKSNAVVSVRDVSPCKADAPAQDSSVFAFGTAAAISTAIVIPRRSRMPISP